MKRWQWTALGIAVLIAGMFTKQGQKIMKGLASRLVAQFEGYSTVPYQDEAGLWTIGYGHLIKRGDPYWHPDFNPNGLKEITQEQADQQLASDTQNAENSVNTRVMVPLTGPQHSALVSLVFNIGDANFASSTLLKKLNAGDYDGATAEFPRWNKVRDPSTGELIASAGLSNRREQEQQIFLT